MRKMNTLLAACCGALLMCASLRAGDKPGSSPKPMPKSSAPASAPAAMPMMEMPKPGPEHAMLKKWVGSWDTKVEDYMSEPGKTVAGSGIWTCGAKLGFWVICDDTGFSKMGLFLGHEVLGYDMNAKHYTAFWVDSTADFSMSMTGTMAGNMMTWTGKAPDMTGKVADYKMTVTWMDDDHANFEMWMMGDKPMMVIKIAYSRRK